MKSSFLERLFALKNTNWSRLRLVATALAACSSMVGLRAQSLYATPYAFSTLAGSPGSIGSNDGTGSAARFQAPQSVAVDGSGNVFVADFSNQTIRKVTSAGVVTTFAGTGGSAGSVDGTGGAARFSGPAGVAVDTSGNVYVADFFNHTIRKITSGGVVTTLAGTAGSAGSTDATGSAGRFNFPASVAVDSTGNVYVADTGNHTIRKITSGGVVTTLAGVAGSSGSADGTGVLARFNAPYGVAVNASGSLIYVGDTMNDTIRVITSGGTVTTLTGTAGSPGTVDGTGSAARFQRPEGITVAGSGNIYVADYANHTIRKITSAGVVTTLAGLGGTFGTADGTGSAARFYFPSGVSVDGSESVFVADNQNFTIRKVTALGVVTTLAGTPPYGFADGSGSGAGFNFPAGVATDNAGAIYVSDTYNHTIRKVTAGGAVTTLAGSAGTLGSADGTGSAARFNNPRGVAVDSAGNVYVADFGNHTIRKITSGGVVTTLAGTAGSLGSADGTGGAARFAYPHGVAVDTSGNVYVADTANCTIREITPGGVVTTIAGTAGMFGTADGTGSAARFDNPDSVAVNSSGTVFVADFANHTIRKITSAGVVTTVAGLASNPGSADGVGSVARFNLSQSIAIDSSGALYVADTNNNEIRRGVQQIRNDFSGDHKSDIIWTNTTTGERTMWLMNGGALAGGASLGTVPSAWKISGTGDFDGDGNADVVLSNTSTGDRAMWLMNGPTIVSNLYLGNVPVEWTISAVGDFNGDGKADIFWTNTVTGDRAVWFMNGGTLTAGAYLGAVPLEWKVSGTGDFNGDGKSDIVWTDTTTGERAMWLMNGGTLLDGGTLGIVPTDWVIAGVGDFDGDGKADIVFSNTSTGDRAMWLMNGTTRTSNLYLGNVPVAWTISEVADFSGDGKAGLFWSNTVTGDRAMWLMDGGTLIEGDYLGSVPVEWVNSP